MMMVPVAAVALSVFVVAVSFAAANYVKKSIDGSLVCDFDFSLESPNLDVHGRRHHNNNPTHDTDWNNNTGQYQMI